MPYTVKIDSQSCASSGRCVGAAPKGFALDDDHLGTVLPGSGEILLDQLIQIAKNCPTLAISLFGEDGEEIDPFA